MIGLIYYHWPHRARPTISQVEVNNEHAFHFWLLFDIRSSAPLPLSVPLLIVHCVEPGPFDLIRCSF